MKFHVIKYFHGKKAESFKPSNDVKKMPNTNFYAGRLRRISRYFFPAWNFHITATFQSRFSWNGIPQKHIFITHGVRGGGQ